MQLSPGSIFHLQPTIIPTAFRGIVTPHATMFRGGRFFGSSPTRGKRRKKGIFTPTISESPRSSSS